MIHYARCNVLINTRFNAIENNRKKQFFEIPDYQQLLLVKLILDIFKLILKESNVIESLETTHEKLIKERSGYFIFKDNIKMGSKRDNKTAHAANAYALKAYTPHMPQRHLLLIGLKSKYSS